MYTISGCVMPCRTYWTSSGAGGAFSNIQACLSPLSETCRVDGCRGIVIFVTEDGTQYYLLVAAGRAIYYGHFYAFVQ